MGLYPLLARAAAIAENENSSFAEALSLAAAERGTPLRRVFADEAEALSHDLGHGGAAEQRAVIDLDNGRIRLEYDHRAGSLRESLDALANHFPTAGANRIQNRLIAFLAEHDGSEELYKTLHNELGLTNQEIEAMGFDLAHRYEPDCDDAYQDIVDYIRFEQETSKMWPWLISGDEMLAQETTLREIAGRLTAAGEWDTESIYESLTEAFGNNLSLDKQSKDDTKEEERNINIKQDQLDLLWQLEEFRKKHEHQAEPSDWAIRMCEAFVARSMGFTDRVQWTELLRQKGETLFTFDWKSGSVSDHVVQWCKENNRNWRYSHLGELQVAHGGEWRKVDYFCRDGSETRVYFPPEPVQEQQLHALAEAPAVHLRDLLTLGLPDHDVYLVHAAEDVGWVPAADLPRLTAQGKEEFSALLDAKMPPSAPAPMEWNWFWTASIHSFWHNTMKHLPTVPGQNMPWNCFCNGGITMKKATVTVSFEQEKLKAVQFYAGKNGTSLELELDMFMEKLYKKYVPSQTREYIESMAEPEEQPRPRPARSPRSAAPDTFDEKKGVE